jgi:hypothetical protein
MLLAVLAVALVGLVGFGSSPSACSSCHAMKPYAQSLSQGSHREIACYSCHLSSSPWDWARFKGTELGSMYPLALIGRGVSGPGGRVARDACLRCHAEMDRVVSGKGFRIQHSACVSKSTGCDSCHSTHGSATRWRRQVVMEDCILCHLDKRAPTKCDTCHPEKVQRQRLAAGPWQLTHGPNWRELHGAGSIETCVVCHAADYCTKCHRTPLPHAPDFASTHGKESLKPGQRCDSCHDRKRFCDTCHKIAMPHPETFLPQHPQEAKKAASVCFDCHKQKDCDACHVKHTHPGATGGNLGRKLPG